MQNDVGVLGEACRHWGKCSRTDQFIEGSALWCRSKQMYAYTHILITSWLEFFINICKLVFIHLALCLFFLKSVYQLIFTDYMQSWVDLYGLYQNLLLCFEIPFYSAVGICYFTVWGFTLTTDVSPLFSESSLLFDWFPNILHPPQFPDLNL